jgi:hypothetical protein
MRSITTIVFGLLAFCLGGIAFRSDQKRAVVTPIRASAETNLLVHEAPVVVAPPSPKTKIKRYEPVQTLKPLSELMPQWAIKSNAPNNFQITFKAHDKTEWDVATNIFETEVAALSVIESTKQTLRIRYEAGKLLSDALSHGSGQ